VRFVFPFSTDFSVWFFVLREEKVTRALVEKRRASGLCRYTPLTPHGAFRHLARQAWLGMITTHVS